MAAETHDELMKGAEELSVNTIAVMEVDGFNVTIDEESKDIAQYCLSLLCKRFCGETSTEKGVRWDLIYLTTTI